MKNTDLEAAGRLLFACLLLAGLPGQADARRVHVVKQATSLTQGTIWEPNIRQGNGEFVTFVSDGDVLGPGTEHIGRREVYLWSLDSDSIVRITNTTGGESYDASRMTDNFRSKKPGAIFFVSTGDLDPSVGNADGNPEIYLWRSDTETIKQLTNTTAPIVNSRPFPSDTGDCMVFESNGDLDDNPFGAYPGSAATGFENSDGSDEVFFLDFHDNDFAEWHVTQVSSGPPGTESRDPSTGGFFFPNQCASTTYQSDYDQLGNGSTGVNVYEHRKQTALRDQLSLPGDLGATSVEPRMSGTGVTAGGPSAVFASDGDLRGNGSTSFQIFRVPVVKGIVFQVTANPDGGNRNPSIADGSATTIFESTGEPANISKGARRGPDGPYNADGNSEIYRLIGRSRMYPVTRTTGCTNDHSSIMGNGRGLAFRSDCDLIAGHNLGGVNQVFVYYEVHRKEPLYSADDCLIGEACCSTGNGCYEEVLARNYRIPRRLRTNK